MKKYRQTALVPLIVLSLLCGVIILTGIILILLDTPTEDAVLFLLGMGIPLEIIWLAVLLPTARNCLLIDDRQIIFPVTRSPHFSLKRNVVCFDRVEYIQPILRTGDGIIAKDTTFYRFVLKDGTEFTETLYAYGKDAEQRIAAHLAAHVRFTSDHRYLHTRPPMPSREKIVELMYDRELDAFSDEVVQVIYSKDHSMRYVILKNEAGAFTYQLETVTAYDETQWQYASCQALPGFWEPVTCGKSLFENKEALLREITAEPAYRQHFT